MGVLLQGFFFGPGRVSGVPSPLDGNTAIPFWWDHLAAQANALAKSGFTAVWLPPPLKGASGGFSSGYDVFDDYDLGSKNQKGTIPTRYGTREQLQRCAAMMRANGIDVYVDLVENQRDGDDGHFNFKYADALGNAVGGRFAKGPGDFHPHVPEDPGVFSDLFQFGRDLAPINGRPKDHCSDGLLNAADWLSRALDLQGFRLDNMKGVSTLFIQRLLTHGSMLNKFAVGEFADGNVQLLENWANAVQHRSAAFDFPLHFALKDMCNNPDTFDMSSLDHAGLVGVDPQGAVTFVENHDTDRGGVGGPIVRNKLLAYAYILTAEGYPCVFYRDYSTDPNCFGLKPEIDRLIQIHENLAQGPTVQRWKDAGVFAFERLGGGHLLVGLNKDGNSSRNITVQTGSLPVRSFRTSLAIAEPFQPVLIRRSPSSFRKMKMATGTFAMRDPDICGLSFRLFDQPRRTMKARQTSISSPQLKTNACRYAASSSTRRPGCKPACPLMPRTGHQPLRFNWISSHRKARDCSRKNSANLERPVPRPKPMRRAKAFIPYS